MSHYTLKTKGDQSKSNFYQSKNLSNVYVVELKLNKGTDIGLLTEYMSVLSITQA